MSSSSIHDVLLMHYSITKKRYGGKIDNKNLTWRQTVMHKVFECVYTIISSRDVTHPFIFGYTSRFRSSIHCAKANVQRLGFATTSISDKAILIILNMAPRKKRMVSGLTSLSLIMSSMTRRTSREFTLFV